MTRTLETGERYVLCLMALLAVVAVHQWLLPINAITAALYMLLVVLGAATRWGLVESIVTSIAGVLIFNFFFLPPVGTFTIADPENWVALFAFLVTAVTVSQLSSNSKRRAEEATARRNEIARLYELSRSLLMEEGEDALRQSVLRAREVLRTGDLAFYDALAQERYGTIPEGAVTPAELEQVAKDGEPLLRSHAAVIPVRLGTHIIGSMATFSPALTPALRESVAGLLALSYERVRALGRAAAAEAAKRNEEFKSSLLDALAHDLKTPLTAIRTCATHLVTAPPRDEKVRLELATIIDQESQRLQATITEVIELARIESGELRLERDLVRLRTVIEAAIADLREEDASRYTVEGPPDLKAMLDIKLMRRAVMQVLENARKYTPRETPVRIGFGENGDEVRIEISDRGRGFHPEELDRVFEKFYRGRRARNSKVEGTGMGLAIARAIVEAHGGTIRALNQPGGGAVVAMSLPQRPLIDGPNR